MTYTEQDARFLRMRGIVVDEPICPDRPERSPVVYRPRDYSVLLTILLGIGGAGLVALAAMAIGEWWSR